MFFAFVCVMFCGCVWCYLFFVMRCCCRRVVIGCFMCCVMCLLFVFCMCLCFCDVFLCLYGVLCFFLGGGCLICCVFCAFLLLCFAWVSAGSFQNPIWFGPESWVTRACLPVVSPAWRRTPRIGCYVHLVFGEQFC